MISISLPSLIIAFLLAITIHEAAHAWMADRLGDPTARLMGRLTLNPLAHIDLYGTVLFPLFLILLKFPIVFGWAKPVRYDPYNLANPRRDSALISLAGPLSNLALATAAALALRIISAPFSPLLFFSSFFGYLILINIALAIFNLLPIHPLDGGKILVGLLPKKEAYVADAFLRRYGILILFFLIFPIFGRTSFISSVIWPVIRFLSGILIPGSPVI